ncbi:hypothetical protein ABID97_001936 [Variovorax sp. OAS795]|uniref:hypothetical protein n=1 Tax=Variovorax sp. OAS795 TaxID=3034231 RepID=UPI0033974B4C
MPINSQSAQGQRIHAFLCKELGIPKTAKVVKVEYGVGMVFTVAVDFYPEAEKRSNEIEVTSLLSGAREFIAGVAE